MSHGWVDYRAVKANVSMEMALATYGIHLHRLDRVYLRGRCPLPTHQSRTSVQSFIVNIEKNAWACHSESCVAQRGGRIGGNVLDFIAWMESCSIRDAALRVREWFALSAVESPFAPVSTRAIATGQSSPVAVETNKPLPFELSRLDQAHPYLQGTRRHPRYCPVLRNRPSPWERPHGGAGCDSHPRRAWLPCGVCRTIH